MSAEQISAQTHGLPGPDSPAQPQTSHITAPLQEQSLPECARFPEEIQASSSCPGFPEGPDAVNALRPKAQMQRSLDGACNADQIPSDVQSSSIETAPGLSHPRNAARENASVSQRLSVLPNPVAEAGIAALASSEASATPIANGFHAMALLPLSLEMKAEAGKPDADFLPDPAQENKVGPTPQGATDGSNPAAPSLCDSSTPGGDPSKSSGALQQSSFPRPHETVRDKKQTAPADAGGSLLADKDFRSQAAVTSTGKPVLPDQHDPKDNVFPAGTIMPPGNSGHDSGSSGPSSGITGSAPPSAAHDPFMKEPAAPVLPFGRISERGGESQMWIGLRTPAFGAIEVHASVHSSQVGLVVGSEHGDLKTFLAAEIPALQATLHQHDLHFSTVHFDALESGSHFQGNANHHDRPSRGEESRNQEEPASWPLVTVAAENDVVSSGVSSLNIHA